MRRILRIKLRLGAFNDPTTVAYNAITHAAVASQAHLDLAEQVGRHAFDDGGVGYVVFENGGVDPSAATGPALRVSQAAREGMTLLKNAPPAGGSGAPALPLSLASLHGKTVAVVGPNANASYILLGSYSDPGCCTAGIPTFLQASGLEVDDGREV